MITSDNGVSSQNISQISGVADVNGLSSKNRTAWSVYNSQRPKLWLDFRDRSTMTFSAGNNVNTITDKAGNGYSGTTPGGDPLFVDGSGVQFTAASNHTFLLASTDFTFLHDLASSATVFVVLNSGVTGADRSVMSTLATGANTGRGFRLSVNDAGDEDRMVLDIGNGTTNSVSITGATNSLTQGSMQISVVRKTVKGGTNRPDAFLFHQGSQQATQNVSNSFVNTANGQLWIGTDPTPTNYFTGTIGEILIYDKYLRNDEINAISQALATKHSVSGMSYMQPKYAVCARGQSNMEGQGLISAATLITDTQELTNTGLHAPTANTVTSTLVVGTNNKTGDSDSPTTAGPIVGVLKGMTDIFSGVQYGSIYAVSGSALTSWINGGANYSTHQSRTSLFIEQVEAQGVVPVPVLFWYQGETESADQGLSNSYYSNFNILRNEFEAMVGGYPVGGYISTKIKRTIPYGFEDTVNASLQNQSNAFLDVSVAFIGGDENHITADSAYNIGLAAATAIGNL
jgi:hypothetical protein